MKSDKDIFREYVKNIPKEIKLFVRHQSDLGIAISNRIEELYGDIYKFSEKHNFSKEFIENIYAGNVNLDLKTIAKFEALLETKFIKIKE